MVARSPFHTWTVLRTDGEGRHHRGQEPMTVDNARSVAKELNRIYPTDQHRVMKVEKADEIINKQKRERRAQADH